MLLRSGRNFPSVSRWLLATCICLSNVRLSISNNQRMQLLDNNHSFNWFVIVPVVFLFLFYINRSESEPSCLLINHVFHSLKKQHRLGKGSRYATWRCNTRTEYIDSDCWSFPENPGKLTYWLGIVDWHFDRWTALNNRSTRWFFLVRNESMM